MNTTRETRLAFEKLWTARVLRDTESSDASPAGGKPAARAASKRRAARRAQPTAPVAA